MTLKGFIDLVQERLSVHYPVQECKAIATRLLKESVEGYKGYEHLVEPGRDLQDFAVAEAFADACEVLEQADDFDAAVRGLITEYAKEHERIIFNGDGYSEEWVKEAEKRGLPNLVSTVDCVPLYTKDEYVSLFERFKVYSRVEIESRTEILLENYTKVITIEALTMQDMVKKQILPTAVRYNKEICDAALSKKALGLDNALEVGMASKLSALTAAISESVRTLDDKLTAVQSICGNEASAKFCRSDVFTVMQELRTLVDELETNMPAKDWPLPSYTDLLFNV